MWYLHFLDWFHYGLNLFQLHLICIHLNFMCIDRVWMKCWWKVDADEVQTKCRWKKEHENKPDLFVKVSTRSNLFRFFWRENLSAENLFIHVCVLCDQCLCFVSKSLKTRKQQNDKLFDNPPILINSFDSNYIFDSPNWNSFVHALFFLQRGFNFSVAGKRGAGKSEINSQPRGRIRPSTSSSTYVSKVSITNHNRNRQLASRIFYGMVEIYPR